MKIRVHIQTTHQLKYMLGFGEYGRRHGGTIGPDLYNELSAFTLTI